MGFRPISLLPDAPRGNSAMHLASTTSTFHGPHSRSTYRAKLDLIKLNIGSERTGFRLPAVCPQARRVFFRTPIEDLQFIVELERPPVAKHTSASESGRRLPRSKTLRERPWHAYFGGRQSSGALVWASGTAVHYVFEAQTVWSLYCAVLNKLP